MDEEEILRSSLEQSNKIDINNFFGSPIGGLANRAVLQSNTSLKASSTNLNLIRALQTSLESLRSQIQQITNYIVVDKQERGKILRQRELEEFEREDAIQKGLVRSESAQPTGLEDSLPFFPEARFSQGLTAGMSSIGERQGVAQFQERFVEGSRPFFFGGLVPGRGNADTVNAKLTPGEFVVPKKTVENFSSNFFEGLTASKPQNISISEEATLQGGQVVSGNMSQSDAERNKKIMELEDQKFDAQMIHGFNSPESNKIQKEIMMLSGTPERAIYTDKKGNLKVKGYSTYDGKTTVDGDEKGKGLFGGLFGGNKKNENVRSDEKEGRGLFGAIGGTIDAATGNLTDFDKKGGKPFGLMRGITGSIDAMTGGLTDLDRRGGKPFGTMRLATGVADAMTGNLFDFDRRGDGKQKQLRPSQDPSHPMYQKIQQLKNKTNQLPMETTVNPDGSITSEGSGTFIGGELVKPGEPLTPMQRAAMTMNIQMGNTYSSEIMEKYNNAGGAPSKEEFDNYEKEKSKSVKPDKEKSKNIKPEQTLGERFMNMFRGDKKEKSDQLLSSAPSSKYRPNTSISSDDSIKTAARGIMQPPQGGGQSETVVLPEQSGGSPTGSIDQTSTSPFTSSTPSHSELGPTSSPVPFIDVISNQYLSVV